MHVSCGVWNILNFKKNIFYKSSRDNIISLLNLDTLSSIFYDQIFVMEKNRILKKIDWLDINYSTKIDFIVKNNPLNCDTKNIYCSRRYKKQLGNI